MSDLFGRSSASVNGPSDVPGLDTQIIKGNTAFKYIVDKIAPWNRTGAVGSVETLRNINPSQINYVSFGDSLTGKIFYDPSTGSFFRGIMDVFRSATNQCDGRTNLITSSGDYWATNGTTHAYDYEAWITGAVNHVGVTGTPGWAKYGLGSAVDAGNEKFLYGIIEKSDLSARSLYFVVHKNTSINGASPSATDTANDVITWGSAHGLAAGQQVFVTSSGGGLTAGTLYYVKLGDETDANTTTEFRLYTDAGLTSIVDLTASITAVFGAGIAVNGVNSILNVDLQAGSELTVPEVIKAGFYYTKLRINSASSGTWTFSFGGYTTGNLAYNISAAALQTAIEGLHADLVGNVGVELSSTTYTILIRCNDVAFNWQGISADITNLNSTAYVDYIEFDSVATGATCSTVYGMVGDARYITPIHARRSIHGLCHYTLGTAGLQMSNMIQWSPAIADFVLNDLKPDICTFHEYVGQAGSDLANRTSNMAAFIALTDSYTATDWIHVGFQPSNPVSDADAIAADAATRPLIEAAGRIFLDVWSICPGYSVVTDMGWENDGIHLDFRYYQLIASIAVRQLGFYDFAGQLMSRKIVSPEVSVKGNLDLFRAVGAAHVARIYADDYGPYIKMMVANRGLSFVNSSGTVFGFIGSNDAVTANFLPVPMRLGSSTGPQLLTHTTSPEGVKTAPPGSFCTDTVNGEGYLKITGTGNTGWKQITHA